LIPSRIRKVLSTMANHRVRALLMGGQACVFYGAAEFSRDTDLLVEAARQWSELAERIARQRPLLLLARSGRLDQLREALSAEEQAERQHDRAYWQPLKAELERLRHATRTEAQTDGDHG